MRLQTLGQWVTIVGSSLLTGSFLLGVIFAVIGFPLFFVAVMSVSGMALIFSGVGILLVSRTRKNAVQRCAICGADLTERFLRAWQSEHYKTNHPEYSHWFKRWTRNFFLIVPPFIAIMIVSLFLAFDYGGLYAYLAGFVVLSWFVFAFYDVSWVLWRKLRYFRQAWKNQLSPK